MADDSVPEEIEEQCLQCHHALAAIDRLLKPVLASSRPQMEDTVSVADTVSVTVRLCQAKYIFLLIL